jgi:hypothetical protein
MDYGKQLPKQPRACRRTCTQGDEVSGLSALIKLITGELPGEEDIVYDTTLSEHGYRSQVSLSCLDNTPIKGAFFLERQDAIQSASETAIELLTSNCNFKMTSALNQ